MDVNGGEIKNDFLTTIITPSQQYFNSKSKAFYTFHQASGLRYKKAFCKGSRR